MSAQFNSNFSVFSKKQGVPIQIYAEKGLFIPNSQFKSVFVENSVITYLFSWFILCFMSFMYDDALFYLHSWQVRCLVVNKGDMMANK